MILTAIIAAGEKASNIRWNNVPGFGMTGGIKPVSLPVLMLKVLVSPSASVTVTE